MYKYLLMMGLAFTLTGCAYVLPQQKYVHDRSNEYLVGQEVAPLNNSVGLPGNDFNNDLPVPASIAGTHQPMSLLPPGSLAAQQAAVEAKQ